MKNKAKMLSVLMLMSMWLTACDKENVGENQKSVIDPKERKEIYTPSDVNEETWEKLNSAYERGRARYISAQKHLEAVDAAQRTKTLHDSTLNKGNAK